MICILIDDWENMTYEQRLSIATHYVLPSIEPSHYVRLGLVKNNRFYDVLISMHKKQAKKNYLLYRG